MPRKGKQKSRQSEFLSYSQIPGHRFVSDKVPLCAHKRAKYKPTNTQPVAIPHPGYAKFKKKYPNVGAWVRAHPGVAAGRLLSKPLLEVIYFSYQSSGKTWFSWVSGNRHIEVVTLLNFQEFDTFSKWDKAAEKAEERKYA